MWRCRNPKRNNQYDHLIEATSAKSHKLHPDRSLRPPKPLQPGSQLLSQRTCRSKFTLESAEDQPIPSHQDRCWVCFQVTYWWTEYWGLWNLAKAQGLEHYDVPIQIWLKYENTSRNWSIYDMCWVMEQASAHCPCLGHGHGTQKPLVSSSTYNLRQTPNYVPIDLARSLQLLFHKQLAELNKNSSTQPLKAAVSWASDVTCRRLLKTHQKSPCLLAGIAGYTP